ncbi:hypothetical protein SAY86_009849 [Trapa natans]|uniref:Uncharacterized protein n=1 Tax=Trapa natans TaxID=22666 RepID=A0AAN7L0E5_TRANT|nr:hypothetical protein SAY86_009849 [Trapa natans]
MTTVSLIMDVETLEKNNTGITYSVRAILGKGNFDDSFEILNNYDWWKDVKLLGFLENVGHYAYVGTMIVKESEENDRAIWLSPAMLSPYKFYQYFFRVLNSDVVRFLKVLTFLKLEGFI